MSVATPIFTMSSLSCADAGKVHAAKSVAADQNTERFIVSLPRLYSCAERKAGGTAMKEQIVDIRTRDGTMETFICCPERPGTYPAILFLMDAPGIREELYDMARRLATSGYYVMLPNLYYRAGRDTKYGPDVLEKGSVEQARMRAVRTKMTIPPVMDDVAAMIAFEIGR